MCSPLGPLCEGAPPAGGGGENLFPGDYDYIRQGRGHNVCLAVSKDGVTLDSKQCLLTNRDYPAGLTCHVRDPKVFAYEGRYYMVLGARTLEDKGEVLVLESTDKLRWTHINTLTTPEPFGYMWECPDLFCLDGQWYLAVSPQGIQCQNVYGCGWFAIHGDWRGDCTLSEFHELDAGFDYYAPQSFVDGNGRRIQIGWMGMPDADYGNAPTVAYGWQHCFTVPRVLTAGPDGTLLQNPVPELAAQCNAVDLRHVHIQECNAVQLQVRDRQHLLRVGTDRSLHRDLVCFKVSRRILRHLRAEGGIVVADKNVHPELLSVRKGSS